MTLTTLAEMRESLVETIAARIIAALSLPCSAE